MSATRMSRIALAAAVLALCARGTPAASFRFTATADSRSARSNFQHCLSQISAKCGNEGVFHISPGDIDPPADNYADLVNEFGSDVVWYPVVGNHEVDNAGSGNPDIQWIRDHYPKLPYIVNPGPTGCGTTTYSFEYGNAHFVVLNEYWDGTPNEGTSDEATSGDVLDELYNWLVSDLDANTKPAVFVFGHEPAYPEYRHVGDSLDQYPANRDRFWKLLNDRKVLAYFCGHTHYYYRKQVDDSGSPLSWTAFTWQIDCGNAGNDSGEGSFTFIDVTVGDTDVRFDAWKGWTGEFSLDDSWTVSFGADVTPPSVVSAAASGDPREVAVTFSERVEAGTGTNGAERTANYSVPGFTVTGATLEASGTVVTLTLGSDMTVGSQYSVTVSAVNDRASPPNVMTSPQTVSFTFTAGPVTVFEEGDVWKYFKGTSFPGASWNDLGFNDSSWPSGPTGIGYGDGDDATVLSDMNGGYLTVYMRRAFSVSDASGVTTLTFTVDYDDGFVAFINGDEVARRGVSAGQDQNTAATSHEAGTPEVIDLTAYRSSLVDGTNVFAIELHNTSLTSSDASMIPELSRVTTTPVPPVTVPFKMNCGVNSYTPSGWAEDDVYVSGGTDYDNWPNAISTAGVANAAPGSVYETVRHTSPHTYTIPIANGTYVVRLHSCEGYSATSVRDVKYVIEGVTVADHMDYATEAGAHFLAMVKDSDLTVTDGDIVIECTGYSSDVFEAGIEILDAGTTNNPPTVSITSPADGASFTAPADVAVTADASDTDGTVARVDLYVNGAFDRTENLAPYEWTLTGLAGGSYTLTAVATDDDGATTTSAGVTVTVQLDPTLDTDGDGMTDVFEIEKGFNPNNADQDGNDVLDGLDDWDGDGVVNQDDTTPGRPPSSGGSSGFSCAPSGLGDTAFLTMLLALAAFARRRARSRVETGRT